MRSPFSRRIRFSQELRLNISRHGATVHFIPGMRLSVPRAERSAAGPWRLRLSRVVPVALALLFLYLVIR